MKEKSIKELYMKITILVAAHKKYRMPADPMYLPVHVGREGKPDLGYIGDNTGDNISSANPRLCELTGIYWAWKNLQAEYIGLVHYRRYFTTRNLISRIGRDQFTCIASQEEMENILKDYDLILPKQRKYYIESLYSHFIHLPYTFEKDIRILRDVIAKMQPGYLDAFDIVMQRTHAHMFNMFVMKKECFDKYCEWLFPIIFEADKRIDVSSYTPMEARAVAYFGEFMMDVWLEKNPLAYREVNVMFMEKQNWLAKGGKFLWRKLEIKKKSK